ncbi:MAG: hypothetical protein VCA18_05830 [Opitutales bacterium]
MTNAKGFAYDNHKPLAFLLASHLCLIFAPTLLLRKDDCVGLDL